jgi:hypothetical protein
MIPHPEVPYEFKGFPECEGLDTLEPGFGRGDKMDKSPRGDYDATLWVKNCD